MSLLDSDTSFAENKSPSEGYEAPKPSLEVIEKPPVKVFIGHVNSYHGAAISRALKPKQLTEECPRREVTEDALQGLSSKSSSEDTETSEDGGGKDIRNLDDEKPSSGNEDLGLESQDQETSDETKSLKSVKIPETQYFITGTLDRKNCWSREYEADDLIEFWSSNFEPILLAQDFIIYDLNFDICQVDELFDVLKILEKMAQEDGSKLYHLILITNPMTWARTEPQSDPVSDKHYRKRRPHPCYRRYLRLEQEVTNLQTKYPEQIRTLILCPGVTIGYEEDVLHYFFKMALYNKDDIEVFELGDQKIPILYVEDLGHMIKRLVEEFPPETVRHIIGAQIQIDFRELTLGVCRSISGPEARLKICPKEQIFLLDKDLISQRSYDKLNLNLNLELDYFSSHNFLYQDLETLKNSLVEQYYTAREVKPIKLIIHGPPTSGKTTLARAIACYYGLHYFNPEEILEDSKIRLERRIKKARDYLDSQSKYEANNKIFKGLLTKTEEDLQRWERDLKIIIQAVESKDPEKIEKVKEKCLRERLYANACTKNQGYVIDGMYLDIEAVKRIFLEPIDQNEEVLPEAEEETMSEEEKAIKSVRISIVPETEPKPPTQSKRKSALKRRSKRSSKKSLDQFQHESTEDSVLDTETDPTTETSSEMFDINFSQLSFGDPPYTLKPDVKPDLVIYLKFDDPTLYQHEKCICQRNKDSFPAADCCSDCSFFLTSSSDEDQTSSSELQSSRSTINKCPSSCSCTCCEPCSCNPCSTAASVYSSSKLLDLVLPQAIKTAVRHHEEQRLEEYHETEYEDKSFYTLMLDCDVRPFEVTINKEHTAHAIYNLVKEQLGPRNEYLISDERRAEERRIRKELKERERVKKELELKKELERKRVAREKQLEADLQRKMELKRKEFKDIETCSLPLKQYLMDHILPKLTEGLVEVAKIRPEDPVDYLAEYLFRNNPQGHMFDPTLSDRQIKNILESRQEELSECQQDTEISFRYVSAECVSDSSSIDL